MSDLADEHDLGSCALTGVGVRVPPSPPDAETAQEVNKPIVKGNRDTTPQPLRAWFAALRELGIPYDDTQKAPQFQYRGWELVIPKIKSFTGIQYRYASLDTAWIWQPDLQNFMGVYAASRDWAKRWVFYWNGCPSELEPFLKALARYERRFHSEYKRVVRRAREMEATISAETPFFSPPPGEPLPFSGGGGERRLREEIFAQKRSFRRDLCIALQAEEQAVPGSEKSQSTVDLVGRNVSNGNTVIIELKLRHLKYATTQLRNYMREWKRCNPGVALEGIYLCSSRTSPDSIRDEVVRARVLSQLYDDGEISVVAYTYDQGRFSYTRCE